MSTHIFLARSKKFLQSKRTDLGENLGEKVKIIFIISSSIVAGSKRWLLNLKPKVTKLEFFFSECKLHRKWVMNQFDIFL